MEQTAFVAFAPRDGGYVASVPMEQLESLGDHPEAVLNEASTTYARSLQIMRSLVDEFEHFKANRTAIPAYKVWELGDAVLDFIKNLRGTSLEIDGLYEHLERDIGIKRKRWEAAITFRRHLPTKGLIPESLRWRECEKNARGIAEELVAKRKEPAIAKS